MHHSRPIQLAAFSAYPIVVLLGYLPGFLKNSTALTYGDQNLLERFFEAIFVLYGFLFWCSSLWGWLALGGVTCAAWIISVYRPNIYMFITANIGSFAFFILPIILGIFGFIGYCGP